MQYVPAPVVSAPTLPHELYGLTAKTFLDSQVATCQREQQTKGDVRCSAPRLNHACDMLYDILQHRQCRPTVVFYVRSSKSFEENLKIFNLSRAYWFSYDHCAESELALLIFQLNIYCTKKLDRPKCSVRVTSCGSAFIHQKCLQLPVEF